MVKALSQILVFEYNLYAYKYVGNFIFIAVDEFYPEIMIAKNIKISSDDYIIDCKNMNTKKSNDD